MLYVVQYSTQNKISMSMSMGGGGVKGQDFEFKYIWGFKANECFGVILGFLKG